MKTYTLKEVCIHLQLDEQRLFTFIEKEWISPFDADSKEFDCEDLERLRLILELKEHFNVNEEGIDIILHLLDQMHSLNRIGRMAQDPALE